MEEENKNITRFEMPSLYKFVFYKFPIIGQLASGLLLIYFIIHGIRAKQTLTYILTGPFVLFGTLIFLWLVAALKVRHDRWASELTVDKERKEFSSYIYAIKKEIKFGVNDITSVGSSSDMFRFFLKDGTWVSWAKEPTQQQLLEEIINSFGIPIVNKKFW